MTRPVKIALGYGAILLWMFLPTIIAIIAELIAFHFDAQLDEEGPHPCIVFGRDIGGALYAMELTVWGGILTISSGFLALIALTGRVIQGRWFG